MFESGRAPIGWWRRLVCGCVMLGAIAGAATPAGALGALVVEVETLVVTVSTKAPVGGSGCADHVVLCLVVASG